MTVRLPAVTVSVHMVSLCRHEKHPAAGFHGDVHCETETGGVQRTLGSSTLHLHQSSTHRQEMTSSVTCSPLSAVWLSKSCRALVLMFAGSPARSKSSGRSIN
ncbi:hypothetical protein ABVT39_022998 [Epinephelus coioides]